MTYNCPHCGNIIIKDSFGYPVCCGQTMVKIDLGPKPEEK